MSGDPVTYLDSSAIVKLAVREAESGALRRNLRRRQPVISSALARTEVARALLPLGPEAVRRGQDVLGRIELVRLNNRILDTAGQLTPHELRSLDAIHLATALHASGGHVHLVTYDDRMAMAAKAVGWTVRSPR
jgi:predicted nucleic acid-binding protein